VVILFTVGSKVREHSTSGANMYDSIVAGECLKTACDRLLALLVDLHGYAPMLVHLYLSEVFKQFKESFSNKGDNEGKRGLWVSEASGREVALPALINESLKQDLQLDLPEVLDVLVWEMLIPGDPEEACHPQTCVVDEVLMLHIEPFRQVCSISCYPQPSSERSHFRYGIPVLYASVSPHL